jgi:hypothetical protein
MIDVSGRTVWARECPDHVAPHIADLPNWKVIQSKNYAIALFRNAQSWAKCVSTLTPAMARDPSMMWPYFAQQAFAIELYLKCVLTTEGQIASGHNLHTLFLKVPKETRRRFTEFVQNYIHDSTFNVEECIRNAAEVFPTFRYMHERVSRPPDINLSAIAACLSATCATALQIANDLTELRWSPLKLFHSPEIPVGLRNPAMGKPTQSVDCPNGRLYFYVAPQVNRDNSRPCPQGISKA